MGPWPAFSSAEAHPDLPTKLGVLAIVLRTDCFQSWYSYGQSISSIFRSFTPLLETGALKPSFQEEICSALCAAICRHFWKFSRSFSCFSDDTSRSRSSRSSSFRRKIH